MQPINAFILIYSDCQHAEDIMLTECWERKTRPIAKTMAG